jgi:predicted RNase H-like HicB family nuclease
MVIDLIVRQSDDGYTAEAPSLRGCETWAPTEEAAIDKAVELARFYLGLAENDEMKTDKARGDRAVKVYKLIYKKR